MSATVWATGSPAISAGLPANSAIVAVEEATWHQWKATA
jgi:hypothetical protein